MLQVSPDQTIRLFPLAVGVFFILLAVFNKPLTRFLGRRPMSEVFTIPRFQRSAKITEKLGRVFLGLFGIGWLIQGIGPQVLSGKVAYTLSLAVLGLSGLLILAMIGVILVHRKPEG